MTSSIDIEPLQRRLAQLRRDLHREPEVGLDLPWTQQKVIAALEGLPLEVTLGEGLSSVTAVLRGRRGGETVLLRGDMDALPITEETGLEFTSRSTGRMHACGHDLHTAMLVGAVHLLVERRDELDGDVVFMFQPGEEGYGGAALMLAEGVLDASGRRPIAAYALHVFSSSVPHGVFTTRPGTMLAGSHRMRVTVRGAGGHGSMPHLACDPIPAACEMVTALQAFVTRRFDVFDPVVVTVGSIHAGTHANVIPDRVEFEATVRSFSPETSRRVQAGAIELCRSIAAAHGLRVEVEYTAVNRVTVNDAGEAELVADTVAGLHGAERFEWADQPLAGSEDFSCVLAEVPGAFVLLGACGPEVDYATAPYNHSPAAVFDDSVLSDGAVVYAELAVRRLRRAAGTAGGG